MKHFIRTIASAFVAGLLLMSAPQLIAANAGTSSKPLAPVTMQLRWLHQFQFAGYYAALHKGFYREKGLDVTIVAGAPDRRPVEEVMAGRAQYGEANSELLFHYLKGDPLVALAAIFQHSPSVLLTRKDSGIRTPQDLIGKRIMMVGGTEDVDFLAMLANEGVVSHKFEILPSSYDIQDLINGKTDAFNAYLTNEPYS
ncbi:MAG: ABC transporter substrate-binding protein, partial [Sulfurimicrobium sp.]|nr:ABC transporter substrate-binding protein [Sulfurimicrobium sp.]